MIYVISKSTFGDYDVRDIQCNANWCSCPYSDYALIPDDLVEGILATKGYCDIVLNDDGTEVTSFTARTIPSVPEECCGENTVLSVNGVKANTDGAVTLTPANIDAAPGGYGLGDYAGMQQISSYSKFLKTTEPGWYSVNFADGSNIGGYSNFALRIDRGSNGPIHHLYVWDTTTNKYHELVVGINNGTHFLTEWVNPPMALGVEYRTTERYDGKPVYTKLMDCGQVTGGGYVGLSLENITQIVRYTATDGVGPLPFIHYSMDHQWTCWTSLAADCTLYVYDNASVAHTIKCQVWYTKN